MAIGTARHVPTPSQTAGPFVSMGTEWDASGLLVPEGTEGALCVEGHVLDGSGQPVTDAMMEFWQADPEGRFPPESAGASWTGFGRALTDQDGGYRLVTLRPGPVPGPAGELQAPHIDVSIFARGLLQRLVTRIYFSDEEELNASDPVLAGLGEPSLVSRLVAVGQSGRQSGGQSGGQPGPSIFRFDIRLQGDQETVFFAPW
jgi:protocatechuate 3,4-dioxygenase, alpha subunit